MKSLRTVVFINSHSRQATQNLKDVKKYFASDQSFEILDFIVVAELGKFESYLKRLLSHKDAECVIVGSGDGTIIAVLNALKNRKSILYGFLPLGTTNAFVRSLGLPTDFKEVLPVLSSGKSKQIHLGSINGTLFANIAGIGVSSAVVENLTNQHKRIGGTFAYFVSGVIELMRHEPIQCELQIDGKSELFSTLDVVIANGRYRGFVVVDKKLASLHKDHIVLVYSKSASRLTFLKDSVNILLNRRHKIPGVHFVPVKKALLKTKSPMPIHVDGEIIGYTPADIQIVKNAIRVLAPPEVTDQPRKSRKSSR